MRVSTIVAVAAVLAAFSFPAQAHTIVWPDGQTFTFGKDCCDGSDCDKWPIDAIKEVAGGYQVDVWLEVGNPPRKRHFLEFVPYNSTKIRTNPFPDRIMGCHSWMTGKEPGTYLPRCIYPIQPNS